MLDVRIHASFLNLPMSADAGCVSYQLSLCPCVSVLICGGVSALSLNHPFLSQAQHRMNRDLLDVQAQQEQVPSKVESLMNEVKSLKVSIS